MVCSKLIQRLRNVDDVFVFAKQCQQIYYTYFRNDRSRVELLSVVKTKLKGRVLVVLDGNNELTVRDDVFQLDQLVDPYRVALSNDLEENLNFHNAKNTFVDVDVEKLNDVLKTSEHTQVSEDDDSDEINVEDCDGYGDDEIKKKDDYD